MKHLCAELGELKQTALQNKYLISYISTDLIGKRCNAEYKVCMVSAY